MRLRNKSHHERDKIEEKGDKDRWYKIQRVDAPEIDNKLVQKKFRIEIRLSQPG